MSMNNVVISTNSDEKTFISKFIKSVMNETAFQSQHTLVCKINSDTATAATVDSLLETVFSASNNYTFSFIIDTNCTITFSTNSTDRKGGYNVAAKFGTVTLDSSYAYDIYYPFASAALYPTEITARCWKYQILSNANTLYLIFGGYTEEFPFSPYAGNYNYPKTYQAFSYKKNTDWVGGLSVNVGLYDTAGSSSTVQNRLAYINNNSDPTAIEVIQNKVAVRTGGTNKIITMDNLWDSSYNSAVMFPVSVSGDSNTYVYLNNYTLMPV